MPSASQPGRIPPARAATGAAAGPGSGFEVVGEGADGAAPVAEARPLRPDVVLMDLRLPVLDGVQAVIDEFDTYLDILKSGLYREEAPS